MNLWDSVGASECARNQPWTLASAWLAQSFEPAEERPGLLQKFLAFRLPPTPPGPRGSSKSGTRQQLPPPGSWLLVTRRQGSCCSESFSLVGFLGFWLQSFLLGSQHPFWFLLHPLLNFNDGISLEDSGVPEIQGFFVWAPTAYFGSGSALASHPLPDRPGSVVPGSASGSSLHDSLCSCVTLPL